MREVGWRENVKLPSLSSKAFKAKMDTGAKASSLHVTNLEVSGEPDALIASFTLNVGQKSQAKEIKVSAPVLGMKQIRSSNGAVEQRPTIRTELELGGEQWPIDVTLTDRSKMKYRMLIGRDAMAGKLCVCPSRSFLLGRLK